jgi:hypothetical protein
MRYDQTDRTQTGASAAGSTSRRDPRAMAMGQTDGLDRTHVASKKGKAGVDHVSVD